MRTVPEWIGSSDDAKIPDRVRLRVFQRYQGRCYLTGTVIRPGDKWDMEHVVALCNGGEHRESNLAPALVAPHKIKTKRDRKEKARSDGIRKRHIGIKAPSPFACARTGRFKQKLPSRRHPFGRVVRRDLEI